MAQLEPLNLRITGNAAGLSAALGRANTEVRGFSGGLAGIASRLGSLVPTPAVALASAFAAVASAAASAYIAIGKIRETQAEIDSLAKSAATLGIRVSELQGIRFAFGESAGFDAGQSDNAIKKFLLNLTEAEQGAGRAKEALDRLGLDAGQLIAAGPVQAMQLLAARFVDVNDKTEQLRLAYDLFGRSAAGVVVTLRGGPEALQDSIGFQQTWNSLTQEQAAAVEKSNDAWGRISTIIEGLTNQIAAEMAPAMEAIAGQVIQIAEEFRAIGIELPLISDGIALTAGILADSLESVTALYETLQAIANLDFSVAALAFGDIFGTDNTFELLDRLEKARAERGATTPQLSPQEAAQLEAMDQAAAVVDQTAAVAGRLQNVAETLTAPTTSQGLLRGSAIAELTEAQFRLDGRNANRDAERAQAERELIAVIEANKNAVDRLADAIEGQDEPTPIHL